MKSLYYLLLLLPIVSEAQQKHDYIWLPGHGYYRVAPTDPSWVRGGMIMDFNTFPPTISQQDFPLHWNFTVHAIIADQQGKLVAYTNGCDVVNENHQLMENGDTLNPGLVSLYYCREDGQYPAEQECTFLPDFEDPNKYHLFHIEFVPAPDTNNYYYDIPRRFYHSIVEKPSADQPAVMTQKQLLVSDIPLSQSMAAVRHANGRDWWIVFPRFMTIYDHPIFQAYEHPDSVTHLDNLWNFVNTHPEQFLDTLGFVRYLFTPTGVEGPFEEQIIGGLWWPGQIRTAEFSPDGSKYVLGAPFSGLQLFDFDRCTGLFSNPITIDGYSGIIAGRGMAIFSPDSKYLYLHDSQKLYQRSLSEPITETLLGDMSNPPFYVGGNHWFNPMNGPDGKLYLAAGDTNTMHRIEFPNRPGADCQVKRHVIKLPTRYVMRSRFNFANYRLGPIDGSSCDSLGIDNVPLANFRYDLEDTLQPLQLTFTDVTDYEPSTWQWFFGDGQSSNEQNPVHVYAHSGTYQVCLTASNANGSSTFCRTVGIGLVGTENPAWEELIQAYPNPVSEQWTILINGVDHPVKMTLSDCTGRYIATHSLTVGINDLNINDLKPGVYFWEVRDKNVGLKKGKVVKI